MISNLHAFQNHLIFLLFLIKKIFNFYIIDSLVKGCIRYFSNYAIVLHDDFIIKHLSWIQKVILAEALTFWCNSVSFFYFLQTTFNHNNQFLESNHSSFENGLLCLVRAYFHLIDDLLLDLFGEAADCFVFFEGPSYKILKSDLIDIISHDSIQGVSSKH